MIVVEQTKLSWIRKNRRRRKNNSNVMKTIMTTVLPVVQVVTSPSVTTIRECPRVHSTLSSTIEDVSSNTVDVTQDKTVGSTLVSFPLKRSLSSSSDEDVNTPVKKRIRTSTITSIIDDDSDYIIPNVEVVSPMSVEITPNKTVDQEVTVIPETTTDDVVLETHAVEVEPIISTSVGCDDVILELNHVEQMSPESVRLTHHDVILQPSDVEVVPPESVDLTHHDVILQPSDVEVVPPVLFNDPGYRHISPPPIMNLNTMTSFSVGDMSPFPTIPRTDYILSSIISSTGFHFPSGHQW